MPKAVLALALLGSGCALGGYDFGGYHLEAAAPDAGAEAATTAGTCVPLTCVELGATCGKVLDGCGGVLDCGGCETGACGEGGPNKCGTGNDSGSTPEHESCVKRACDQTQGRCESVDDGCGGMISCGNCTQRDR